LAGGTGLVGSHLLRLLLKDPHFEEVLLLCRQSPGISDPKLETLELSFDRLMDYGDKINGETLFCCLGTTRKKAKTPTDFEKIDFEYVRKLARICVYRGVLRFSLISSLGARPNSPWFYLRTKAKAESSVLELPIPSVQIYRPSLIVGERNESRWKESVAQLAWRALGPFIGTGKLSRFRPCPAASLAAVMLQRAKTESFERTVYESEDILRLAEDLRREV